MTASLAVDSFSHKTQVRLEQTRMHGVTSKAWPCLFCQFVVLAMQKEKKRKEKIFKRADLCQWIAKVTSDLV